MLTDSLSLTAAPTQGVADVLAAGDLRVALAPRDGGRIAAFWVESGGGRADILAPMAGPIADPLIWPKAGCYPLVPFSNRIRNGRFSFGGVDVALPAHPSCPPHALHGFSQLAPWSVERLDGRRAVMRYAHSGGAWPWAFSAEQRVTLSADALVVDLVVRNDGDRTMPVGLGLHPYFAVAIGDRIAFAADREWRQDDAGCGIEPEMLSGADRRYDAPHDRRGATRYFADWSGVAEIARRDGIRVALRADAPLDHFVFHVPDGGAYACMEPVSHVADAFNLASAGVEGAGLRTLSPQGEIAARMTIAVRR